MALDLLHEKSHELSRFAEKVETPKDRLLEGNFKEPRLNDEDVVRRRIASLMRTYASEQPDSFHKNESVNNSGRRVRRPKLREPKVI